MQHTEEFYDFYKEKMMFLDAKPNKAHLKLAELEAAGLIRRESRPGSREAVVQYVGAENCRGHLHLTCTRCGRTVHLSSAAASLLTGMAAGEGFSLDLTRTALYGLCPQCRQEVQP